MLPLSPIDQNARRAKIDLELDAHGRTERKGTLRLTGHPAWEQIHWQQSAEKATQAWKEWLEEAYRGYTIADLRVDEQVDEERVEVSWTMTEREEEVLEDEASLPPSRPLGPVHQPFAQPAADRRTAVLFDDAHRDEVEMTLRWPEGWKPDTLPSDTRPLFQMQIGNHQQPLLFPQHRAGEIRQQADARDRHLLLRPLLPLVLRGRRARKIFIALGIETQKNMSDFPPPASLLFPIPSRRRCDAWEPQEI